MGLPACKPATPKTAPQHVPPSELGSAQLVQLVNRVLDDFKAQQVTVLELAGKASFADYLVIATATSSRHAQSMGQALRQHLGKALLGLEGAGEGEWVCADAGSVVVHVFTEEKRKLYQLEKLWSHVFVDAAS